VPLPHQTQQRTRLRIQAPFRQRGNPRHVGIHQQLFRCRVAEALVDLLGNVHGYGGFAVSDQLLDLSAFLWWNIGGWWHLQQGLLDGYPTLEFAF
jgi:hypothetical protein